MPYWDLVGRGIWHQFYGSFGPEGLTEELQGCLESVSSTPAHLHRILKEQEFS